MQAEMALNHPILRRAKRNLFNINQVEQLKTMNKGEGLL
jgi:hypothetical protein